MTAIVAIKEYDTEPYELIKVAWEGPYILPYFEYFNSPFSVQIINRGDIAWFRPDYTTKKM